MNPSPRHIARYCSAWSRTAVMSRHQLQDTGQLARSHLLPAARADLLRRLAAPTRPPPPTTRPSPWSATTPNGTS